VDDVRSERRDGAVEFVAIDWETANDFRGSACEVGLTLVRAGRVVQTWSQRMQPPGEYGTVLPRNREVHGITQEDLVGEPPFATLWPQILEHLGGLPLVAHNAQFDLGVLRDAVTEAGLPVPSVRYACSLVMARRHWDRLPAHKLDMVCKAADVPLDRHHAAGYDAQACAMITLRMAQDRGARTLDALMEDLDVAWGHLDASTWTPCVVSRSRTVIEPQEEEATATLW
jgi:DNA polymerase III subunit epsilon